MKSENSVDYIEYLQEMADSAVGTGKETQAQAIVTLAKSFFDDFNGAPLASVFFTIPLLAETIRATVLQYAKSLDDRGLDIEEEEWNFLNAVKTSSLHCAAQIDEILMEKKDAKVTH